MQIPSGAQEEGKDLPKILKEQNSSEELICEYNSCKFKQMLGII